MHCFVIIVTFCFETIDDIIKAFNEISPKFTILSSFFANTQHHTNWSVIGMKDAY